MQTKELLIPVDMLKKTLYNAKLTEIEGRIPSITGLATTSALTAVENKIPDVSNSVKKTDYNAKILDIEKKVTDHDHDKYSTTSEFSKLSAEYFAARLAQENLVTNTDFDTKLISLSERINSNKTKYLLVKNQLEKLKPFDLNYFVGENHFEEDGGQNYLVFQPIIRYFRRIIGVANGEYINFWKVRLNVRLMKSLILLLHPIIVLLHH